MFKSVLSKVVIILSFPTVLMAACPHGFEYPVIALTEGIEIQGQFGVLGKTELFQVFEATDLYDAHKEVEVLTSDGSSGGLPRDQMLVFVPDNDCLPGVLTMDDVRISAENDGSPLHAKAIASITLESIMIDQASEFYDVEKPQGISIRATPSDDGRVIDQINLFTIVFIYGMYTDPATQDRWFFVGSSPSVEFNLVNDETRNLDPDVLRSLGGWVRREDLIFWPHREAIYPNTDRQSELTVFVDAKGQEPLVTLEYVDDSAPNRMNAMGKIPLLRRENGRNLVVVPINRFSNGEVRSQFQDPSSSIDFDAEQSNDLRYIIGRLLDGAGKIDVLFVLDNTESMEVYRSSVLEGIRGAASESTLGDRLNVAIAMFGDKFNSASQARVWAQSGPRNGVDPNWRRTMPVNQEFQFALMDFGWRGEFPTLEDLEKRFGGVYSDPMRDKPEIGLSALRTAIDVASWDADPDTIRFVFYIGDDTSRTGPTMNLAQEIKRARINVFPINVAGNVVDQSNRDWVLQMNQLRGFTESIRGLGGVFDTQLTFERNGSSSPDVTRDRIENIIGGVFDFVTAFQNPNGDVPEFIPNIEDDLTSRNIPGGHFSAQTFNNLLGASSEEIIDLLRSTEIVQVGYYPEGYSDTYVALSHLEHSYISGAMDRACIAMGDSASIRGSLENMAEALAEAFTGDTRQAFSNGSGETLPQFFARITHLPDEYFSVFGNRNIDEFTEWVRRGATKDEQLAVQRELCLSDKLLDAVTDQVYVRRKDYRFEEYNERLAVPTFRPKHNLKEGFDWLWGDETSQRMYFIPKDFFPSGNSN